MKKYYLMYLYQVSPKVGYLKSGEKYCPLTVFTSPDNEYKLEATTTIINTNKLIMVEKIFPSLVREVKTGIVFPIINFITADKDSKHISSSRGKVHTFVCSVDNKLLATEITTSCELQRYNRMYPDSKKLKEELQAMITTGKSNMEDKIAREIYARQEEYEQTKIEDSVKKQERVKIRKMQHHFRQERRKI